MVQRDQVHASRHEHTHRPLERLATCLFQSPHVVDRLHTKPRLHAATHKELMNLAQLGSIEGSLSSDSTHNVIDLAGLAIVHVTVHRNARSHTRVLCDLGHVLLDRLILIVDVQEVDVSAGSTFR